MATVKAQDYRKSGIQPAFLLWGDGYDSTPTDLDYSAGITCQKCFESHTYIDQTIHKRICLQLGLAACRFIVSLFGDRSPSLRLNQSLFMDRPNGGLHADNARKNFHKPGGDHMTMLHVYKQPLGITET